jgi:hypothetical protein
MAVSERLRRVQVTPESREYDTTKDQLVWVLGPLPPVRTMLAESGWTMQQPPSS